MPELLNRHALRERHFKGIEMHKTCDPQVCSRAAIGALLDELDRLHTWDGLMSLVDEHYPANVFPVEADRDDRDRGPRILSLLKRLDGERAP